MRPGTIVAAAAGLAATAGLVLTLSRVAAEDEPARASEIKRLIAQLGSHNYKEREAAGKRLEALGEPAWVAVRQTAAATPDLEIRHRAERLAQIIGRRVFVAVRRFTGHSDGVITVAVSPNGKLALSGAVCYQSKDGAARLWDVATGRLRHKLEGHTGGVYSAAFLPGGKRAVTGKPLTSPLRHHRQIIAVAFSPDGKALLTGSDDETARLWSAASGQALTPPLRHQRAVIAVAFSPDGKAVATASEDWTARLWSAATGKELTQPLRHQDWVLTVAFSPDSKAVLTGSVDQTAQLWSVATG
jgi:WD40 repeat protein